MPDTARLTKDAESMLEDIKDSYDVDVNTSKVVELALQKLHNERV